MIGEFIETPLGQHRREGDTYLDEFRATKSFPHLRSSVTRQAHAARQPGGSAGGSAGSTNQQPAAVKVVVMDLRRKMGNPPKSMKKVQAELARSVHVAGAGPMADFTGQLIKEKLKAKAQVLAKERAGLRATRDAYLQKARLADSNALRRVLAKVRKTDHKRRVGRGLGKINPRKDSRMQQHTNMLVCGR